MDNYGIAEIVITVLENATPEQKDRLCALIWNQPSHYDGYCLVRSSNECPSGHHFCISNCDSLFCKCHCSFCNERRAKYNANQVQEQGTQTGD